jgi:2',3'-cyclic-nucleotide 2'-phosphodiesterase (5'-nucleotidase family)
VLVFAGPDTESHAPSQSIADVLREASGAEAAFIAAGHVKDKADNNDLASFLRYPTDELSVVDLKGSQIRAALVKSVSLYPQPYDSFLQLSNIDASFKKGGMPESRLDIVMLGGQRLDDNRTYRVAMPATLARGGMGYFRNWDKKQISKTLEGVSLEELLRGKTVGQFSPRWKVLN